MNRNKLLGRMAEVGISQAALSRKIYINPNTMSGKINGKVPFNLIEVEKICIALNLHVSDDVVEIFLPAVYQK